MKQIYVCERCGAQYSDWDEAYKCENSHVALDIINRSNLAEADDELMEIVAHYEPGSTLPSSIAVQYQVIDSDTGEQLSRDGIPVLRSAIYTLASKQPNADLARINASLIKRRQEDAEYYENWRRQREEAAKEDENA